MLDKIIYEKVFLIIKGVVQVKGNVFNIQRYTIHDGPGLRIEIFLKGCPLSCEWCSNPESHSKKIELGVYKTKCIGKSKCGLCIKNCPDSSMLLFEGDFLERIDYNKCINCMKCYENCPTEAIKVWGEFKTVEECMEVIRRDLEYYESSGGGVTVSGGDPILQTEFVSELFKQCKKEGIHICFESAFFADWKKIEGILEFVDLFITDIKHMNSQIHKDHCGVANDVILNNIINLSKTGKEYILRIPIIPGFNDNIDNIKATADFIDEKLETKPIVLQLLSFMRLGEEKYASLGRPYLMEDVDLDRGMFQEMISSFANYFNERGITCSIGTELTEIIKENKFTRKE